MLSPSTMLRINSAKHLSSTLNARFFASLRMTTPSAVVIRIGTLSTDNQY